jgi:phage-related baseplate assembly protein
MRFSSSIAKVGAWVDRSNLLEPTVNLALMTAISGNWVESNAISPSTLRWDWAGTTGIASADLVAATQQYIERDDIKQATDVVRVSSCSVIEGIIDVTLHHLQGPDPVLLRRSAAEAISKLIAARKQPHRDMPSSAVSAAAFVGGVERVSVTHPAGGITAQFGQMVHIASIIVRSAATDV